MFKCDGVQCYTYCLLSAGLYNPFYLFSLSVIQLPCLNNELHQAKTIKDLAKRDFANLRHEGDDGEPQPKVVRRGRPPSNKNQKKSLETSPLDRIGPELSSGAALTSGEDKATGSNSYNLRKAPPLHRFRSSDLYVSPYRSRNGEYSEWLADWNDEFPGLYLCT